MQHYYNRKHAGVVLAQELIEYKNQHAIILGLPRGGVPVAFEIAQALNGSLDVLVVRKLGVPYHRELAVGAIANSGAVKVFNEEIIRNLALSQAAINKVIAVETQELIRRENFYRNNRPFPSLEAKIVILVDDGIATGASIKAAINVVKVQNPLKLIVAVPVADKSIVGTFDTIVDQFICPLQPDYLNSVGEWYEDFSQTTDNEVIELLEKFW